MADGCHPSVPLVLASYYGQSISVPPRASHHWSGCAPFFFIPCLRVSIPPRTQADLLFGVPRHFSSSPHFFCFPCAQAVGRRRSVTARLGVPSLLSYRLPCPLHRADWKHLRRSRPDVVTDECLTVAIHYCYYCCLWSSAGHHMVLCITCPKAPIGVTAILGRLELASPQ